MPRFRFVAAAGALAIIVSACSTLGLSSEPDTTAQAQPRPADDSSGPLGLGSIFGSGGTQPADGYVVGDEPNAVKAGADILNQGGSAADAAAAMYFTLAVTYPGSAGLGGGGLCLVYDPATGHGHAITFLARDAVRGGAYAVPGNVAGFARLQALYGQLPWQRDVAYGEALAASGFPISNALAARLQTAQNVVRLDAGLAAEFLDEDGHVKPAGTVVSNPNLAATLARIREQGAAGFYKGAVAADIAAYAAREGGPISRAELAAIEPVLSMPQVVTLGDQHVLLPPASVGAGSYAAAVISALVGADGEPVGGSPAAVTRRAAQAALRKFGVQKLPADLGATGFAVLDKNGEGVACAVTMNGPFGSGHTVLGTGVTLASSPAAGQTGLSAAFLTPLLATSDNSGLISLPGGGSGGGLTLVGAGAGGPNGTAGIANGLLRLARGDDVTKPGDLPPPATSYDSVNAIACQNGICAVLPDTRAHGLGAAAAGG